MTSPASAALDNKGLSTGRRGFTLAEMLIVIGVVALLVAITVGGLNKAQKAAQNARTKADMQAIVTALEAYAHDFKDAYPMTNNPLLIGAAVPGQHILAKALMGPGLAAEDGVDGPGFRAVPGGKPWPPYLQPEKFKTKFVNGNWEMLDAWENPILYLPQRYKAAPNAFPVNSPQDGMYDPNDAQGYWDSSQQMLTGASLNGFTACLGRAVGQANHRGPYILISAGRDGRWLTDMGQYDNSDDIYNFER